MDNSRYQAVHDKATNRIVGRLKKDVDLFEGIKEVCRNFQVTAAHFQCIGSLTYATFVQVAKGDQEGQIKYSEKVKTTSEVEIIGGTGFIGYGVDGEIDIHFHGIVVDCDKEITGGHFIEGENPVAITIEFIILPVNDVVLQRAEDKEFGVQLFNFLQKERC